MCGIVGYIGRRSASELILDGLRRLEYRGYDSAGIAVIANHHPPAELAICRAEGKLANLTAALARQPLRGTTGIGHTRWATHGRPSEENAHPHRDCRGQLVVVHNGIIENYLELKRELSAAGHAFRTGTDTECIAHLLEAEFGPAPAQDATRTANATRTKTLEAAVRAVLPRLRGVYALAVIATQDPEKIVAVRQGPPLVVGQGEGEYFIASDAPALLPHTREMIFLEDEQMAVLTPAGIQIESFQGQKLAPAVTRVLWDPIAAEKGGYRHFMLKEIHEQPRAVRDTLVGRLDAGQNRAYLDDGGLSEADYAGFQSLRIVACGTSWHAALAGKFMIERLARLPVEVDYGSEFRYRDPLVDGSQLAVMISQSGETADTLAALREARSKGAATLAICNAVGSLLAREAQVSLLTHAGPEIGVASTKAFTAQLTALAVLGLFLGRVRGQLAAPEAARFIAALNHLPAQLEQLLRKLSAGPVIEDLVKRFHGSANFLYLGRGIHYPIALEGALKLKEISYIHAEGYPAGEMKHGPNALIDETLPVVVLAGHDPEDSGSRLRYEKTLSNIQEVAARSGQVIAIVNEGTAGEIAELGAAAAIEVPSAPEILLPILEIVPLQLLAYEIALRRGCDVDQPRNLAKSVTVE